MVPLFAKNALFGWSMILSLLVIRALELFRFAIVSALGVDAVTRWAIVERNIIFPIGGLDLVVKRGFDHSLYYLPVLLCVLNLKSSLAMSEYPAPSDATSSEPIVSNIDIKVLLEPRSESSFFLGFSSSDCYPFLSSSSSSSGSRMILSGNLKTT